MIVESGLLLGGAYYLYRKSNKESISRKKRIADIRSKWSILMDGIGNKSENKIEQQYEVLDVIEKHYGFDAIISIPIGKKYIELQQLIPQIELLFKANSMIELSSNKTSAYLRVHYLDKNISMKDDIRFKWFKTFYNIKDTSNNSGEILRVDDLIELKSPYKDVVGYKIVSKIPLGVGYKKIVDAYDIINKTLGKCYFNFNTDKMVAECSIITKPFDNMVKFAPIKVKPWELFVGMRYDWIPVIFDYSQSANCLIGGVQGSGKTVSLITAFLNLCINCDDFKMFVCNCGEKEDLVIFKYLRQCSGFVNSIPNLIGMLRYLKKEMERRYKLFSSQDKPCFNIFQYNKMNPNDQLEVWHFLTDEVADLIIDKHVQDLIWSLARKGRASGIYCSLATQRGSISNLSPEIKAMLRNKVCFSQVNQASAQTIMGGVEETTDMVMSLEKNREFVVDYMDGIKIGKTLCLTEDMMGDYLLELKDKSHRTLAFDSKGNLINKNQPTSDLDTNVNKQSSDKEENKTIDNTSTDKKRNSGRFINLTQKKGK